VVGLYLAPPANAAVLAVGIPERGSSDYVRHGTVDLFAALNIATSKVIGKLSAQHRPAGFQDFLDEIDCQTEPDHANHGGQHDHLLRNHRAPTAVSGASVARIGWLSDALRQTLANRSWRSAQAM
jgi:hypothetical protein